MKNTLEDYEFSNAVKAIEKLLEDIYCKNCLAGTKQDLEIPKSKKFVLTVLDAIGIVY